MINIEIKEKTIVLTNLSFCLRSKIKDKDRITSEAIKNGKKIRL